MMLRRRFLGLTGSCLVGACASMVVAPVHPRGGKVRLNIRDYPTLDRPGGYLKIRPEGSDGLLYVLVLEEGGYAVVSPTCKHLGCTVDLNGRDLLCPCHGSMYARDGRVLRGPTEAPLDRYRTEITPDGQLVIELGGSGA